MKWIDSLDIEDWGKRINAKGQLPHFLGRLIRATTPADTFLEFPSGIDVYVGGWDGQVIASKATSYVPAGLSLWEIGTEVRIKNKANTEYNKRSEDPLDHDPADTTFIFVTTRKWRDKNKWCNEKKAEGIWKDVKVYDARNLEEWFSQTGAVVREFAATIGKYPSDGIQGTEDFWKEYSIGPKGQLSPSIITIGRKREFDLLKSFLALREPRIIAIRASSKEEAIAFIIATVMQMDIQTHENFFASSLIIDTIPNFRSICNNQHGLYLIPRFEDYKALYKGVYDGHHILLPLGGDDTYNSKDIIELPRLDRDGMVSELEKYGLNSDESERLTLESGRNITIIKRLLDFPQGQVKWASQDFARDVIPALLMGRWDSEKDGDQKIIELLSGIDYEKYLEKIIKWKSSEVPLLYQIGTTWRLASPLDAWTSLSSHITSTDLQNLEKCVLKVLKDIRPYFDLPLEKRYMATFYGKEYAYSEWLREGLTQSLVLVGVFGTNMRLAGQISSQNWVDSIIRKIFSDAEGRLWASLNYLLPLMAEVSPDAFIEAINKSLNKREPEILKMFEEEPSLMTSHSHHTGLLWALEGLAWFPEFLSRVTLILGRLAEIDPGGSLSNRPINTLRTIFLPWMPQTTASKEDRHSAISKLVSSYPDIAWSLLVSLLPRDHDVAYPSHKTRWRIFNVSEQPILTTTDVWVDVSHYLVVLLNLAGTNESKISQLLSASENMRFEDRELVFDYIDEVWRNIIQTDLSIWNAARHILHRHRSHPDVNWSLDEGVLSRYQSIYDNLYPFETIDRYQWLFEDHWPEFPEGFQFGIKSHDEQQEIINDTRKAAIQSIYNEFGFIRIDQLSSKVKEKWAFGIAAAFAILDMGEEQEFVSEKKLLDAQNKYAAWGFIYQKSVLKGWDWVSDSFNQLKDKGYATESLASFLLPLTQNSHLWSFISKQDPEIESQYWRSVNVFLYKLSLAEKSYAITKLLSVDRGLTAIHEASGFFKELPSEFIESLLRLSVNSKEVARLPDYEIKLLIDELHIRYDISRTSIAELEWMYLLVFTRGYRKVPNLVIYEELASSPKFFISVIKWLFKPGNENEKEEIGSADRQSRAEQAYRLLSAWSTVPGLKQDGEFDEKFLIAWVHEARLLAKEEDRELGADIEIGKILAQFPERPDSQIQWPPEAICELIDTINSDVINRNFSTALFNKRGFSSKSPYEGGQREWNLAKYFHDLHDKIIKRWPISASLLKNLAKGYEEDAIREDQRAERDSLER